MLRRSLQTLLQGPSWHASALPSAVITLIPELSTFSRTFHTSLTSLPDTYTSKPCRRNFTEPSDATAGSYHHSSYNVLRRRRVATATPSTLAAGGAEDFNLISLDSGLIRIEGYDDTGFIVNDVQVEGPVLCYGDIFLLWDIQTFEDITIEKLSLLDLIKPLPDLLVIGCGSTIKQVPESLLVELKKRRVNVEALDTMNAVSTFNILNQESRKVLGALLPAGTT